MKSPQVVIMMGSQSDLPTMKEASDILKEFGVSFEVRVLSTHRAPEETSAYARALKSRGVKVVIAGAGGAAALAGVVASLTPLPVIGVPIQTAALGGMDSLLSTVQMPPGVPVATVAIGTAGARNAGFLAIRILGLSDKNLLAKLEKFRGAQAEKISKIKVEL